MREMMKKWLQENPEATTADAFEAGWMACTDSWCHGKREKLEQVGELVKQIFT